MKYYYIMDTTEGIKCVKTKKSIRNREQARKEVGCGVNWICLTTPTLYYIRVVMNFLGWQN